MMQEDQEVEINYGQLEEKVLDRETWVGVSEKGLALGQKT